MSAISAISTTFYRALRGLLRRLWRCSGRLHRLTGKALVAVNNRMIKLNIPF